ncbi:MAG: DUF2163 domain-containing protein [Sphingomonas sp.]|nr:DUF2163 domain-containing protein [Sphingomonas sp.]
MTLGAGDLTSLAFCWTLERRDGAGLGLTSHDQALVISGTRFAPSPAINPAAVRLRAGLEPQRGEVEGALSNAALSERDLEAGRWDGARVSLFAVDWDNPDGEQVKLVGGGLGPVSIKGSGFSAELVGAADTLSAPVCPETSSECRAELGDRQCRVDLAWRREMFGVTAFAGGELGLDRVVDARFLFGETCFLDGENAGWRSPVIAVLPSALVLRDVPLFAVAPGCRVRVTEGCDKRFTTCRIRFANSANFRGEPHLPGNDLLTRYPGG